MKKTKSLLNKVSEGDFPKRGTAKFLIYDHKVLMVSRGKLAVFELAYSMPQLKLDGIVGGFNYTALTVTDMLEKIGLLRKGKANEFAEWFHKADTAQANKSKVDKLRSLAAELGYMITKPGDK